MGFIAVHAVQSESRVDDHKITDRDALKQGEAHRAASATKIDQGVPFRTDRKDLTRDGYTHGFLLGTCERECPYGRRILTWLLDPRLAARRLTPQESTRHFSSFPTLKNGSFFGGTLIFSPVFGFRPMYAS